VGSITVAALAAYAFSRFRFRGSDALFVLLLISLAIPTPSLMIAEYVLLSSVNLVNTYQGIILLYMAWNAFAIILFRNAFRGIPQSLVDAAVIQTVSQFNLDKRSLT
jgi:ABC-type glycerol-3-phosphate transport system permease component